MGFVPATSAQQSGRSCVFPLEKQARLNSWIDLVGIEALILSGGNNIGEVLERDLTENVC